MATRDSSGGKVRGVYRRKNADGTSSFIAQVRLVGLNPTSKAFNVSDFESVGAARKAAAQWVESTKRALRDLKKSGGVRDDISTISLGDVIDEYLKDPETKRLRTYDDVHRLLCWWKEQYSSTRAIEFGNSIIVLTREARDRLSAGRDPATVNRYLSQMRRAWHWAGEAGYANRDQHWPKKLMLREPKGRVRFLDADELAALLKAARAHDATMYAAVVVSIATGIRQGELLRLRWNDVNVEKQTLTVHVSKNDEARTVYLPASARDALTALSGGKVRAIGNGPVFLDEEAEPLKKTQLDYHWRSIRAAAGLKDFRWHDLRHSCASYLAQEGATLMQIGAQLGHKSPAVTMRYAHLVQGAPLPAHAGLDVKLRG
jgi:integrase